MDSSGLLDMGSTRMKINSLNRARDLLSDETDSNFPQNQQQLGSSAKGYSYRPPALRTLGHQPSRSLEELSDASDNDEPEKGYGLGSGFSAGYRRARAGTMPSSGPPLALDPYGNSSATNPTASAHTHSRDLSLDHYSSRSSSTTPIEPFERQRNYPIARPTFRHANSSSAALDDPTTLIGHMDPDDAQGRLRSGSLTLTEPAGGVSNAFGSGFSNTWLQNPAGRSSLHQVTNANGQGGKGLHQVVSRESNTSSHSSGREEGYLIGQSTVDYLGLTDNMETPRAATFGFQAALAAPQRNINATQVTPNAARLRASTVSVQPKSSASFQDLISAANMGLDRDPTRPVGLFESSRSRTNSRPLGDGLEYLDNGIRREAYGTGYADELSSLGGRPRATTISMLDQPSARLGHIGSHGSDLMESLITPSIPSHVAPPVSLTSASMGGPHAGRRSVVSQMGEDNASRSRRETSRGATGASSGTAGDLPTGQTPTRSIWLGNLDVMTTAQDLNLVFQGYGEIESLRLLPEKSCAFVNFIDRNDAIRAKDDVQIRMHNMIPSLSDTPIRIGFGKIDSVPTAQPSASTMQYSMSNSSASSVADLSDTGDDLESIAGGSRERRSYKEDDSDSPSRSIWVGNLPIHVTQATLMSIFSPFGAIETARALPNKQCGFINFENLASAISAQESLNGREFLGSEFGPIKVAYANVPVAGGRSTEGSPSDLGSGFNNTSPEKAQRQDATKGNAPMTHENVANIENYGSNLVVDMINLEDSGALGKKSEKDDVSEGSPIEGQVNEQQMVMAVLSQGDPNKAADIQAVRKVADLNTMYYSYIPTVPERGHRKFDSVSLKDIRRRLDGGYCSPGEIDQIAKDLMDDCVVLASDYIGNNLIQKLYASASKPIRMEILSRMSPALALAGTHKHGTWAAQKIVECATTEEEMIIIERNLAPFIPPLSADSYGNYLVSACLRFPAPHNGFVYDAMVDRTWDIAQTRFGARCMRTCLESPHISKYQKKRIAGAIILNSVPLATNPNGVILLTWLMDAHELPGRYGLLATRLGGFVQHLATHKLSSLTILRIVGQKVEPEAGKTLIKAIFTSPNDQVLREILQDQVHGAHAISKMLIGENAVSKEDKPEMLAAVKRVLESMRNVSGLTYKRLLEECGLPVPAATAQAQRFPVRREGNSRPPRDRDPPMGHAQNTYRPGGYGGGMTQPQMGSFGQFGGMMPEMSLVSSMQAFQLGQGMTGSLSPLIMSHNNFGQGPPLSPTPTLGSFATPHAQLMSPNSDPFNPFAMPSQLPRNPNAPVRYGNTPMRDAASFDLSPTLAGLGMQSTGHDDFSRSPYSGFAGPRQN